MLTRRLVAPILVVFALSGCGDQSQTVPDTPNLALVKTVAGELLDVPPTQLQTEVPIGQMKRPMDDLDLVELVMELEHRLQITISDEDLMGAAGTDSPEELPNRLTLREIANIADNSKTTNTTKRNKLGVYRIEVTQEQAVATDRDTIGGAPHLPKGQAHPRCKMCQSEMVLFLQFDVRSEFGLPFQTGSHLLAFMCPNHNEIPPFAKQDVNTPLPAQFWENDEGHYALLLVPTGTATEPGRLDPFIEPRRLRFVQFEETVESHEHYSWGSHELKVGGVPGWLNYAVEPNCPCGGKMRFVCQIPDNFGFRQTKEAPEQPNSFSRTEYCLFLGNFVYILACERQCSPKAVIAVCDN